MIYPYSCTVCSATTEVIAPVSMHTHYQACACGETMNQVYSLSKPIVDDMEATYYPSLGGVIKSKKHRKEVMKRKGLIEVGNERPATVHSEMEKNLRHKLHKYEV